VTPRRPVAPAAPAWVQASATRRRTETAPPGTDQAAPRSDAAHQGVTVPCADPVAVVLLADLAPGSRLWGAWRMVRGPGALRAEPGLHFAKVLGSGQGGGFGLRPSLSHQGLFALFDGLPAAQAFVETSETVRAYRAHARELCLLVLRACSSRGRWSGQALAVTADAPVEGPIVALTRASIRPGRALPFWRMAPPAQAALAHAPGCLLAAGLGEAPLLRQATLSVWESVPAMDAYARSGAHGQAIRAASSGGFFSETMFVRFAPLRIEGSWLGRTHAWRAGARTPRAEAGPGHG
jgi:hypothetical protein